LKTIILLEDEGLVAELGWKRQVPAFPLIPVGGNSIIGHTLDLFEAYVGDELIIVTPDIEVAAWLFEQYPDLSASCVKSWDDVGALDGEVLVINGRFLTNPNLPAPPPAVAAITNENGVAMALWTKNGATLHNAPSPHFENWLSEAVATDFPAHFSFPVRTIAELQYANMRLLGLGYGSEDLVERSYAEEFMGLPPVFLHETAVVTHSIIGPYAHIGADAQIKSSIIRNSIIGAGAQIENCILDGAIISENSKIIGESQAII
jgi:hypothetical protein